MKRLFIIIAASLLSLLSNAQGYTPTTTWPYLYPDFMEGETFSANGTGKKALLNVHLLHASLHFIDGQFVKEMAPGIAFSARIGEDYFINAGGRMMKILAKNDNGYVAECAEIDIVKLNSSEGAYGSSATTLGTMSLSSLEGIGATNSSTNTNHMELKANKENGQSLPLIRKKYLFVAGKCIYATKKDVMEAVDAADFKAFLKANKIKWSNPQSLLGVVDYIAEHK